MWANQQNTTNTSPKNPKRGDTWQALPFHIDYGDTPEGAAFWAALDITCDLRIADTKSSPTQPALLLAHATVIKSDGGWFYPTVAASETQHWVVDQLVKWDMQITYAGQVISSPTYFFTVQEDVTHV